MTRTARPTDPASAHASGGAHAAIHSSLHAVRLVALLTLVAGLFLPTLAGQSARAQDGGQATIVVTSFTEDGVTPLPFARFQVTDSLGTVYPARESAPPDGVATLTVDVIDDTVTYTVAEETPPACGIAPEPQVVSQLAAGETEELSFSTSFEEDCDLGSISIYSYTCPDGLDLTITDYAQYRDNCLTTNDGAEFTIVPADAEEDDEGFDLTTGEFGISGRAPLVGLVPGEYLLTERNNESNLASMIYCLEFQGIPGEDFEQVGVNQKLPNADGEVELELDGGRIACDIFRVVGNLPANTGGDSDDDGDGEQAESDNPDDEDIEDLPPDDGAGDGDDDGAIDEGDGDIVDDGGDTGAEGSEPASIEFHVATCPVGYDGPDPPTNVCHENGTEGITFSVIGQGTGTTATSDPSAQPVVPGVAITTISGLPADTYTMGEDVPGDFVEVFVYCADVPGGGPRVQTPQTSEGSQEFDITLAPGQDVICDWYIIPVNAQGAGTGILRLTAYGCEPGYTGTSFGEVTSDCAEPVNDVEFNLISDIAGYDVDKTTNDDGKIRFLDIAPGDDYVLDEDLPGDFLDDRIAYCAVDGGPYVEYDASTGTIQLDPIADGQEIQCLWYIVPTDQNPEPVATATTIPEPAEELAVVRVTKFTCEPGYGGRTFAEVTADCPVDTGGVEFNLIGNILENGVDVTKTTNSDGKVRFTDIPAGGGYLLYEYVPGDALDTRMAFCATNGGLYIEYDVDDGVANLDPIAAGDDVQCLWFNVPTDQSPDPDPTSTPTPAPTEEPAEPGTLRIHKSECPPGQRENFYDDCYEDVVGGIGFNVDGPSGYDEDGTTSDQGIVTFDDVPAGDLVVTELQPAGYQVDLYVVVCSRDGAFFETTYDDSSGLRVLIDLPAGATIVCDWYNVPPGPPPTPTPAPNVGTITLIVSLCELEVEEIVSFADDCDPYGDGADFTLTAVSGGASQTGTTGTDSRVAFANLASGAYALEETSLDWCKAQADSVDGDGNVMVSKGTNTNVYIYNCLPDGKPAPGQPGGSKSVVKVLPSTGTGGPAAVERGIGLATWGLAAIVAMSVLGMAVVTPALVRRCRDD